MRVLTSGHINVTPLGFHCELDPEAILSNLRERPYGHPVPSTGWGGFDGDLEDLRNSPGTPARNESIWATGALFARLLYDERDPRLERGIPPGISERELALRIHETQAVDVVLPEGQSVALVATHSASEVTRVARQLELAVGTDKVSLEWPVPNEREPSSDLFLWLLSKTDPAADTVLGEGLRLESIRTLQAEDALERKTRFLDWAHVDRPDVLMVAADPGKRLGPAKLVVTDEGLGLQVSCYLRMDGSFSVYVGGSMYFRDDLDEHSAEVRLSLVRDTYDEVMRKLVDLHRADQSWAEGGGREAFRKDAERRLANMFSA